MWILRTSFFIRLGPRPRATLSFSRLRNHQPAYAKHVRKHTHAQPTYITKWISTPLLSTLVVINNEINRRLLDLSNCKYRLFSIIKPLTIYSFLIRTFPWTLCLNKFLEYTPFYKIEQSSELLYNQTRNCFKLFQTIKLFQKKENTKRGKVQQYQNNSAWWIEKRKLVSTRDDQVDAADLHVDQILFEVWRLPNQTRDIVRGFGHSTGNTH